MQQAKLNIKPLNIGEITRHTITADNPAPAATATQPVTQPEKKVVNFSQQIKQQPAAAGTPISNPLPEGSSVGLSQPATANESDIANLIGGDIVAELADLLMVFIVSFAFDKLMGIEVDEKSLYADAKEKKVLAKLWEDVLKGFNLNTSNPIANLLIGMSVVYGTKALRARAGKKQAPKKEKAAVNAPQAQQQQQATENVITLKKRGRPRKAA